MPFDRKFTAPTHLCGLEVMRTYTLRQRKRRIWTSSPSYNLAKTLSSRSSSPTPMLKFSSLNKYNLSPLIFSWRVYVCLCTCACVCLCVCVRVHSVRVRVRLWLTTQQQVLTYMETVQGVFASSAAVFGSHASTLTKLKDHVKRVTQTIYILSRSISSSLLPAILAFCLSASLPFSFSACHLCLI